jgi:hypothetical protein
LEFSLSPIAALDAHAQVMLNTINAAERTATIDLDFLITCVRYTPMEYRSSVDGDMLRFNVEA